MTTFKKKKKLIMKCFSNFMQENIMFSIRAKMIGYYIWFDNYYMVINMFTEIIIHSVPHTYNTCDCSLVV